MTGGVQLPYRTTADPAHAHVESGYPPGSKRHPNERDLSGDNVRERGGARGHRDPR